MVRLAAPVLAMLALLALVLPRLLPHSSVPNATAQPSFTADIVIPAGTTPAPDFSLQDQNSQAISVSGLRGRVLAITFLDSHCKQLCPIEAEQLAKVQQALGNHSALSIVVISVAPSTDTPSSARGFAAEHGWTGDWHWLLGTSAQLAPVWKAYSVGVQPTAEDILHTTVVYLIDKKGYLRAGFASGLQTDLVARDVRVLEAGT